MESNIAINREISQGGGIVLPIKKINPMEKNIMEHKKMQELQNKIIGQGNNIALAKGVIPDPRKRQFIKKGILGIIAGIGIVIFSKMTRGLQNVIATTGKGIDFSANTQSAVTGTGLDSELLDWYEEGSWTPVLKDAGQSNSASLSTAVGRYTRVGRVVHIQCKIVCNGAGSISNQVLTIYLHGLPFTAQNTVTGLQSSFAVGVTALLSVTAGVSAAGVIEQNGVYITILLNDATTGMSNMQFNELTTSGHLSMAGSYTV